MFRSHRLVRCVVIGMVVIALLLSGFPAIAQQRPIEHLVPIGGGYADIYAGFSQAAVANARNNQVKILVLPFASATDPVSITAQERAAQLKTAEERRFQIEEACKRAAPQKLTCQSTLAPILTRGDAEDPTASKFFTTDFSAILVLDGDPAIGMRVTLGTPLELAPGDAYTNGVIVAGAGAGGNLQSTALPTNTPTARPTAMPINTPTPLPTSTLTPTPTRTPTVTPTATATPVPTAVPFGTSATGEVLPILPITIGAALLLFVVVLVAGRRRK